MKLSAEHYALGAAALGVGFILWKWGVSAPLIAAGAIVNTLERGNKLSESTVVNGIVSESPEVLADMASAVLGFTADVDTYSLARMGRSEGVDGMEYRMHVALNDIAELSARGLSAYSTPTKYMTYSRNVGANGHYSSQSKGKRVATTKDPYEGDYFLAQKVQLDRASGFDPTNGATKFVDKSGPFYIEGVQVSYSDLVASWAADGLTPMSLPGATSNFVVFVRA